MKKIFEGRRGRIKARVEGRRGQASEVSYLGHIQVGSCSAPAWINSKNFVCQNMQLLDDLNERAKE